MLQNLQEEVGSLRLQLDGLQLQLQLTAEKTTDAAVEHAAMRNAT